MHLNKERIPPFRVQHFTNDKWTATKAILSGATLGLAILLTFLFGHAGTNIRYWPLLSEMSYLNRSLAVIDSIQAMHSDADRYSCKMTCSIEIVESIPENITFDADELPMSTFSAWSRLISLAEKRIYIAAYKTSLRGKHVLGASDPSTSMGEQIFEQLLKTGTEKDVTIRMVENYLAKDPGDNADGSSLESRGALELRRLHVSNEYGKGAMHSKFIVVDDKHFYLGSANLDWRSLNQKMELGVLVLNCPCLANDLGNIFFSYWNVAVSPNETQSNCQSGSSVPLMETTVNAANPVVLSYYGAETKVFIASSPRNLHEQGRVWDLEAITSAIHAAKSFIYIHVMDFIPMIVYQKRKSYWPVIDNALRKAVVERGVEVKILAAALHFVKENLHFMQSLQALANCADKGSIEIKIFKVPAVTDFHKRIARDRRTHNKFMVTEDTVIIDEFSS
uniref:PLD phosphodiesterase domain-containing protein n=1 Tax=Trichuris muris TaxID=70415 RepID=A0A5S6Q1J0_TRIMR